MSKVELKQEQQGIHPPSKTTRVSKCSGRQYVARLEHTTDEGLELWIVSMEYRGNRIHVGDYGSRRDCLIAIDLYEGVCRLALSGDTLSAIEASYNSQKGEKVDSHKSQNNG